MASFSGSLHLPRAHAEIVRGMELGWHRGAQLYVSRRGAQVEEFALGESSPGYALTPGTIMLWLSSGKPIGAAAAMQLVERGRLELDDPIARHIPEFAAGGKQDITLRHILTHTAGFRWIDLAWETSTWEQIIRKLCACKQERDWPPGTKAGYHPTTSWYSLGELVRRVDGRPFSRYVREEIFEPLGMLDMWIGMPTAKFHEYGPRIAIMPDTTKPDAPGQRYCNERGATSCVPGGNCMGPAHDLAKFYEMLLAGGVTASTDSAEPRRILSEESVRLLTTRQRIGMYDQTFRHVMDWSLGLIMSSNRYGADTAPYGYGVDCSDNAFGHGGSQSSVGFADPEYGLVVTAVMNGMPGEAPHHERMQAFLAALYQDLGLA